MKKETIKKMEKQEKLAGHAAGVGEFADYRDTWRIFKIMSELVEGYNFLMDFKQEVTVFGSARLESKNKYYKLATELTKKLSKDGFTIITGGGPGIMEAANKGAHEVGGESVGLNINLPFEQRINKYVKKSTAFYYFFTRKVMMTSPANAFLFFPGGFGTMDEFFEVVDLMDQGLLTKSPIVMVGKDFWQPVLDFLNDQGCSVGSVTPEKMADWHLVDTAEEAYELVKDAKEELAVCDLSPNNFHCEGKIDWKIFRVMAELVEGFDFLTGLENAVTVLGTKSIDIDSDFYHDAYDLGAELAKKDYSVVTGAKFGTAEAANKGAFEAGGNSIGIGMKSVGRKEVNSYLTRSILFDFTFIRKLIFTTPTKAMVFFPGGLGSMHLLFEVLTLMQTKKIEKIPLILYNKEFWGSFNDFIQKILVKDMKTIEPEDGKLFHVADSVEEVIKIIES